MMFFEMNPCEDMWMSMARTVVDVRALLVAQNSKKGFVCFLGENLKAQWFIIIFPIQMDIFLLRASPPFLDTLTEFQLEHQPTTEGESGQQQLSGNALEHHHFRKGLLQRIAGEL